MISRTRPSRAARPGTTNRVPETNRVPDPLRIGRLAAALPLLNATAALLAPLRRRFTQADAAEMRAAAESRAAESCGVAVPSDLREALDQVAAASEEDAVHRATQAAYRFELSNGLLTNPGRWRGLTAAGPASRARWCGKPGLLAFSGEEHEGCPGASSFRVSRGKHLALPDVRNPSTRPRATRYAIIVLALTAPSSSGAGGEGSGEGASTERC
ncbi:hypothetical protein, partial [Streptomyces alkaliterrae]